MSVDFIFCKRATASDDFVFINLGIVVPATRFTHKFMVIMGITSWLGPLFAFGVMGGKGNGSFEIVHARKRYNGRYTVSRW